MVRKLGHVGPQPYSSATTECSRARALFDPISLACSCMLTGAVGDGGGLVGWRGSGHAYAVGQAGWRSTSFVQGVPCMRRRLASRATSDERRGGGDMDGANESLRTARARDHDSTPPTRRAAAVQAMPSGERACAKGPVWVATGGLECSQGAESECVECVECVECIDASAVQQRAAWRLTGRGVPLCPHVGVVLSLSSSWRLTAASTSSCSPRSHQVPGATVVVARARAMTACPQRRRGVL